MNLRLWVAVCGIGIGTFLLLLGSRKGAAKELRTVGGFLLVASFCYLLGVGIPPILPVFNGRP